MSSASEFVHLHNHSEYSLLDAIARCEDIAARCQELGFGSFALTDHGVMYGAMEFYITMREAGLKPIVGCEFYVAPRRLTDKDPELDRRSTHLVLLAKDHAGYANLMRLTSIAHVQGMYYKPRIDVPAMMEHREGLIALTGCPNGVVAGPFHKESEAAAHEALERYLRIFGSEDLFIELQNHGLDFEARYRQWAIEQARKLGLRTVATNDCHYVHSDDARAHDIALCLRDKKLLTDTDRMRYSGPDYYIKSVEEMAALFPECPEALANTSVVAAKCNLELDLHQVHFPRFEIPREQALGERAAAIPAGFVHAADKASADAHPEALSEAAELDAYLRKLTYAGAQLRYGEVTPQLQERIEYELSVIIPKGFTPYFLICADFCSFARGQNIPVGPGRGSAAGSVVAYCLEITDLDPLKYGLYFERFLNPERIELPDFDIDFCYRRRDEVIEHVKRKYGADRVALLITYSRLKARAVIKAVGRTKGLEYQYVDRVTKEIRGLNPTIDEAIERSTDLQKMLRNDAVIAELLEDAKRLEGIASHHGVHAAGLVIAPDELASFVPVQPHRDSDLLVTQYAMDTVPKTGLVKFDFLGLRNLTMIQDTVDYIREHEGVEIDPRHIPDDDAETFAMLQKGDSYGVFQFEAPQVKRMLNEARPETVMDLTAINAANRPGPLASGNTAQYLENRKNRTTGQSQYPSIAEILAPTGGVLLYQEQVLEIAKKLGGFTLGEADLLRKAMGKKKFDVMEAQKAKFLAGVKERKVPAREAELVWEMMAVFAGYGFNKAHSLCYAWIAYQTAYLKCHYPQYFMCAMLNSFVGNSAKLAEILAQCRKMRIPVLPPSVNEGHFDFTPLRDRRIIFGLGGIKGMGHAAVDAIVAERQRGGPYETLASFLSRTRGKGVNKKALQSLATAGAFDGLGAERVELIRNIDDIENFMRGPKRQEGLFLGFDDGADNAGLLATKEVTALDVAMLEKQSVGVFLTGHPFAHHPMFRDKRYMQLAQLAQSMQHSYLSWQERSVPKEGLVGLLTDVKVRVANTSNKAYAKCRLEDAERSVSVLIWPKAYESGKEFVFENSAVVLKGRVQVSDAVEDADEAWDSLEIVVDSIEPYCAPAAAGHSLGATHGSPAPHSRGGVSPPAAGSQEDGGVTPPLPTAAGEPPAPPAAQAEPDWPGMAVEDPELDDDADAPPPEELNALDAPSCARTDSPGLPQPESKQAAAPADPAAVQPHKPEDSFSPLPIDWEIDLKSADRVQLAKLARALESASGDCEVRLRLREVSGQLRWIKVNRRFYASLDVAEQLEREFPFITPAPKPRPEAPFM